MIHDCMHAGTIVKGEFVKNQRKADVNGYRQRTQEKPLITAKMIFEGVGPQGHFKAWCEEKGVPASLRQARKFLQAFPNYRG